MLLKPGVKRNLWATTQSGLFTPKRMNFPIDNLAFYLPLWHPELSGSPIISKDLNAHSCTVVEAIHVPNLGRDFDGVDDVINCGDNAVFDFGTGDFTLEAWVRWDGALSSGDWGRIIAKQKLAAPAQYYFLWRDNADKLGMRVLASGGAAIDTLDSVALSVGVFYHCAGVRSGTNLYFYKNGELVGSNTIGASASIIPTGQPLSIGNYHTPVATDAWDGVIGEVWGYKGKGLTQQEIQHDRLATKWRYS